MLVDSNRVNMTQSQNKWYEALLYGLKSGLVVFGCTTRINYLNVLGVLAHN